METAPWLFVEVGGSSIQTAQRDPAGRFWFTPGLVRDPGRPIALACPGLIRDGRVLYATNLGWPDEAEPGRELGVGGIGLVVNDAEAAAVGESVLRAGDAPTLDLLYVTLGTGVGSARVCDGAASYLDLAHRHVGGTNYCAGCRSVGCLNSLLESRRLPHRLTDGDQAFVAQALAAALAALAPGEGVPLVLGGGIARRYPAIAALLDRLVPNPTALTRAPAEAKSAAYAGLDYLARQRSASATP